MESVSVLIAILPLLPVTSAKGLPALPLIVEPLPIKRSVAVIVISPAFPPRDVEELTSAKLLNVIFGALSDILPVLPDARVVVRISAL
jgi:hypothetical protein